MQVRSGMLELAGRRLRDGSRRGVILVLSTFLFIVMFAFAAFAIDLGFIVLTAQQLQNAADAACLSAVLELKGVQSNLTRAEIKEKALIAAQETALKNIAATRPVQLYANDLKFGNRSVTNVDTGQITTVWESYGESGTGALNAVSVDLKFGHGDPNPGREALGLFFAKVIGTETASVDGLASSHLTPRDLVFVIDVSGSMLGGSGGNMNYAGHGNMLVRQIGNIYPSEFTPPVMATNAVTGPTSAQYYAGFDNDAFNARFFPPRYPQRVAVPAQKGQYQTLWNLCFNTSTPRQLPNIDMNSATAGVQQVRTDDTNSATWISMERGDTAWGTTAQRDAFFAQEFPGLNVGSNPWNHWKWRAFCDFCFITVGTGNRNQSYNGTSGQTKNLNLIITPDRSVFANPPDGSGGTPTLTSSGSLTWRCVDAAGANCAYLAPMGPETYIRFTTWCGFTPAVRGQDFWVRDADNNGTLDTAPTGTVDAPQPSYMGYYPKTKDIAGFDKSLLFSGGTFQGVYPGDLDTPQISFVRRGTLHGLHAMIEQESTAGSTVAYNKVGMALFATQGFMELPLTNDLDTALKVGVSRIAAYPGQIHTNPMGSGRTNWGSGMRAAVNELTNSPRARNFAQKSMVLLSDGVPNYHMNGNHENAEVLSDGTIVMTGDDTPKAAAYARHWVEKGYNNNGIITHAVGFNISVGSAADTELKTIADSGRGVYRNLPGTAAGFEQLKKLFVDIAKDKLGKLYLGE